ncbi:uncharacterized protein STEHIDRAFT_112904 [Stereum hirsutum FP-91666 SS1]|uniref:uncharacterized protein n=1 Tax=Stereum hirsutum (strain FP-91666) TaxID=721885 RepID=UPI0004449B62|nr:uncharacterized protein STEHIDRAFT_112904 [Stereum hirsutum FP-91666 SS1]EIM84562.1 hypothetical protein STEHIDRAFT_112904 [Stereum hirsutum FP-91666 SS1]
MPATRSSASRSTNKPYSRDSATNVVCTIEENDEGEFLEVPGPSKKLLDVGEPGNLKEPLTKDKDAGPTDNIVNTVKALTTCPICHDRLIDPVMCSAEHQLRSTTCGHMFCADCLHAWFSRELDKNEEAMKFRWRPNHLNEVLRLGLDPRSSPDAIPILNSLRSGLFTLCRDLAPESQRSIQTLSSVSEAQILGPQFECPTCREVLVASPARSFVIEGLLEVLPAEAGGREVRAESPKREEQESRWIKERKGKGQKLVSFLWTGVGKRWILAALRGPNSNYVSNSS